MNKDKFSIKKSLVIFNGIFILLICMAMMQSSQSITPVKNDIVIITTKFGDIEIMLYDKTPLHRENFIRLANSGYFDSTLFHRVVSHFVIQGGDPDSKKARPGLVLGNGGPGYEIPAEFIPEYIHKRGAVGMARESDDINPLKKSSGSQFYIVTGKIFNDEQLNKIEVKYKKKFNSKEREIYKTIGGSPHLDGNYTVFGEVVRGMDVVDKIATVKTDSNNRPLDDIIMIVKLNK